MSMDSGIDAVDIQEWRYLTVKGKVAACVKGNEPVEPVAKYVRTVMTKTWIQPEELNRLLAEVEHERITLFAAPGQYERRARFQELAGMIASDP